MASLAASISSLKPQPINPISHKLLGFNYLSNQTLKLPPTHQPFSTTRPNSKNFTTKASIYTGPPSRKPPQKKYNPSSQPPRKQYEDQAEEKNVTLCVYAINEQERGLSHKPVNSMGNLVPFSNKIYGRDEKKVLGITAGVCVLQEKNGERYEANYNFHFGDYGHVSVQGQCSTSEDTILKVTGRSGIFEGVQGTVKLEHINFPVKLFYTFYFEGIENLPYDLMA